MGIIQTLSSHEAQKIAAGEVVERPYNIVKELIENSLDAGATQITLYIQEGGKKFIRCIDNGHGMAEDDARKSVEHHATSKLTTIDDLERITTFGFRGEALSSICAVSTMTLATQMQGQEHGTELRFEYGELKETRIISRPTGTDITVDTIFDNVPVRKKFLKTRETELRALMTLVQAVALAHKQVAFILYHDNHKILTTQSTDSLSERVAQLFDPTFSEQFLECTAHDEKNSIMLSGGLTHYQYQRYDRNQQFFFVNRRWIKNYKVGQAFNKGFQGVMPPGRYPAGIIFIEVDQSEVDINVHPRKEEVVFLHPRLVETTLEKMVQKRLEEATAQRLKTIEPIQKPSFAMHPSREYIPEPSREMYRLEAYPELISRQPMVETIVKNAEFQRSIKDERHYSLLGQLMKTYILHETPDGLLILDQHAAHEAILYEQFSSKKYTIERMQLLFPEIIPVTAEDQKILISLTSEIQTIGISFEPTSSDTIAITETPLHIKNYSLKELIYDILSWIHEHPTINQDIWQSKITKKLYAMMACKAAVKAGDELSSREMEELMERLYKTEHRLSCPHGRPTTWLISPYELEKTFKRKT